ncbi:hypothetical protein AGDE_06508 [Angomonas deanei]|uniref:Uncharacterized protein n=1 Tax=Angomonas deanei TaxID=59799 RepID=S9U8Y2_9TRYP|nr:hypothetical protein AGDE_11819 [Angomonas deanei]EPY37426.1 hypothetical protein AGDE_06508 [Angomonas deanei]CAD2218236.1 hypothetical protein, conserved [Angomonas deanei]|eukprot:EPY25388.1 hypothetical protein AGDE_11819 [Angomonas deanei]
MTQRHLRPKCETYLKYLFKKTDEMQSLHQILPGRSSSSADLLQFQKELCSVATGEGYKFAGVKLVPPSHEIVKGFQGSEILMSPVFSRPSIDKKFSIKHLNINGVEPGICLFTNRSSGRWEYSSLSPALELTGSRFPFFASSLNEYHSDLCGNVNVITGKRLFVKPSESDLTYHFVVSRDGEPVSVGFGKLFETNILKTTEAVRSFVNSLGVTFEDDHFVLFSGVGPKTNASPGHYTMNWGKFGTTSCTLL